MKFVIKTKDRVDGLRKDTYSLLSKYGVSESDIYLFVSSNIDYDAYTEAYPDATIVLGAKGIVGIDNFIVNYFDEGDKYIYMNDDVSGIYKTGEKKKVDLTNDEFYKLIDDMFNQLDKYGFTYSALYPCDSTMYMNNAKEFMYDLCLCMDPFSAIINNKNIQLTEFHVYDEDGVDFVGDKSDVEKSLLHFLDKGGLVRFNKYCIKVKYCNQNRAGGIIGRTPQTEEQVCDLFKLKYEEYIKYVRMKKDGFSDIRLKTLKSVINK